MHGPSPRPTRHQRGSMAIAMMLMLLGLITILGIVEVGYLYWAHRDAQKVADLAALSGAQQLPDCTATASAASDNALNDNNFSQPKGSLPTNTCGTWDPVNNASTDHFSKTVASGSNANAVKVVAQRPVPSIWGFAGALPNVSAEAVAINSQPIASFSVGSSLAKIDDDSPLNSLLSTTLGTSLGLQLLSYNGIANTDIKLLGLIKASQIDVGTVSSVLSAPITVTDFLTAYVQALQQSSNAANINFDTVNAGIASIEAQIGNTVIDLGSILNVNANTDDPDVALNTDVNALDILNAVVLAADSKNAVALPAGSIDVPDVATVNLSLAVIEPPQIAVGPVGTSAHTAAIRLKLDVSALATPLSGGQSFVDLPLYVEVAPADATIKTIQCNVAGSDSSIQDTVVIEATPGIANAFLGNLPSTDFANTSTTWETLVAEGTKAPIVQVSVGLLGALGISVPTLVNISASSSAALVANPKAEELTFNVDPSVPISQQPDMTQTAGASSSSVLGSAISSLLGSTTLQISANTLLGVSVDLPASVLSTLLGSLSDGLTPVLTSIDNSLTAPLLQAIGLEIGTADVNLRSVDCNAGAQLVY